MCNTFAINFQIFVTFGYKKVKNSEITQCPDAVFDTRTSFILLITKALSATPWEHTLIVHRAENEPELTLCGRNHVLIQRDSAP